MPYGRLVRTVRASSCVAYLGVEPHEIDLFTEGERVAAFWDNLGSIPV